MSDLDGLAREGNYLKFFERAAVVFLGVVPGLRYHFDVEAGAQCSPRRPAAGAVAATVERAMISTDGLAARTATQ